MLRQPSFVFKATQTYKEKNQEYDQESLRQGKKPSYKLKKLHRLIFKTNEVFIIKYNNTQLQ